ncbi:MAG: hypothetical protein AAF211_03610, partial [Myxococcota bacterium]
QHQLATEQLPAQTRSDLADWVVETQATHEAAWGGAVLPDAPPPGLRIGWDRGFVTQAFVERVADDVIAWLDALQERPLGRGLNHVKLLLTRPSPDLFDRLLSADFARGVRSWSFSRQALGPAHARVVARRLTHARALDLRTNALGDGGMITLAEAPFDALESLHVEANGFGSEGLLALADARWPRLRALLLMAVQFSVEEAEALAGATYFDQLEVLHLPNSQLRAEGARILFGVPRAVLRMLGLAWNGLHDGGIDVLDPERLPVLRRTSLIGNQITTDAALRFVGKPWRALRMVDLWHNPIEARALPTFHRCPFEVVVDV